MTAPEQKEYDKEWRIHGSVCKKVMKALREAGRRDLANDFEADAIGNLGNAPDNEQAIREKVKFNSEDLILLAHDEWKRREERKHIFDETTWAAGFLSGFCTSRKWAREYVDKLRQQGERG